MIGIRPYRYVNPFLERRANQWIRASILSIYLCCYSWRGVRCTPIYQSLVSIWQVPVSSFSYSSFLPTRIRPRQIRKDPNVGKPANAVSFASCIGHLRGRSPGLSLNLSSNNPFRKSATSPTGASPPQPRSPFDDPPPRPVSTNPFLDPSNSAAGTSSSTMPPSKDPNSYTAEELFVCQPYLMIDDLCSVSARRASACSHLPPRLLCRLVAADMFIVGQLDDRGQERTKVSLTSNA